MDPAIRESPKGLPDVQESVLGQAAEEEELMISNLPLAERVERVSKRLCRGVYHRIVGDYASTGVNLFDAVRFANDLGTFLGKLYEIGLVADANQNGWSLPVAPDKTALRAALPRLALICSTSQSAMKKKLA